MMINDAINPPELSRDSDAEAQLEYDSNPELRDLLTRAYGSPTVARPRK